MNDLRRSLDYAKLRRMKNTFLTLLAAVLLVAPPALWIAADAQASKPHRCGGLVGRVLPGRETGLAGGPPRFDPPRFFWAAREQLR